MKRIVGLAFLLLVCQRLGAGEAHKQLLNLSERPKKPRFKITDRVWPAKHGEMHICLWAHDKKACVTFGVDDNICPEHAWWLEMGRKYNIRCTWFVIVYPLMYKYDGTAGTGQGFFGTLDKFETLFKAGHDVQMHGTTAINKLSREGYEKDVKFTQDTLAKIPGNTPNTYAYPGGEAKGFKREVVAKYCIGSRGTQGGINVVNRTDYLNLSTGQVSPGTLASMLDDPKHRYFRGWLSQFTHAIATSKDPATRQALYDSFEAKFKAVQARRDELWVPTYREAFLYAQSRDTARLAPGTITPEEVRFTLGDDMKDEVYTYPLTVKVRIHPDWDAVQATQDGKPVPAEFILHQGNKYLLVQAVPDKGEVLLKKAAPAVCLAPVGLPKSGKYRDKVEITLLSPTTGAQIRYTLDGQAPGPDSSVYDKPVTISKDGTVTFKAACFRAGLKASPVVQATYEVWLDKEAPVLKSADAVAGTGYVALTFSEEMERGAAETPDNYTVDNAPATGASLLADKKTVVLKTAPIKTGAALMIKGVEDPSGNAVALSKPVAVHVSPAAKADGLTGYFAFSESTDATAILDSCGTAAPGLIHGTAKRVQTDKGPALVLDDKSSVIVPAHTFGMAKANALTVALWVRFDGALKGNVIKKGKYATPFSITGYAGRQALQVYARVGKDAKWHLPGKLTRDTWVHVALTVGDGKVVVYKDGKAVQTQEQAIQVRCPNEPTWIGGGFAGAIADLRFYARALTADEVAKLAGK